MKSILICTAVMAALASGAALAQSTTSGSSDPSVPQTQPTAAQPQSQQPQAEPPATRAPNAAQPGANQAQATSGPRIAPGSVIPVQLTKTIDAKKAKPGDEVVARVTMDLRSDGGAVVVPKDTKVVGHVTEAQARSKEHKESQVGIAFDHAILKDGDLNLPMSIQAVIAPPSNNANAGGADPGAPAGGGATSPMGGGRMGSAGGASQAQPSSPAPNSVPTTSTDNQPGNARPPINGNTQGVVGISNLKLEAGQNGAQGSVLSSEKNNVKVESGSMLLLKVSH